MTQKTCPVCAHEAQNDLPCPHCGWEFPLLLGNDDNTLQAYQSRLEAAQQAWQQRHYNPDLEPMLERDPFETPDEFATRLSSRPWYVGQGILQKQDYDIDSGRFPLKLEQARPWTRAFAQAADVLYLTLDREKARSLYQQGAEWPLYGELAVEGERVQLKSLQLLWERGTLLVSVSNRYRDNGDGTVTDIETGLMWMRTSIGQRWENGKVVGEASRIDWDMAVKEKCDGFAGYQDWRLPSIDELKTLVYCRSHDCGIECQGDYQRSTIDLQAFPDTPDDRFWSHTPCENRSSNVWAVYFGNGNVYRSLKVGVGRVRLVRTG